MGRVVLVTGAARHLGGLMVRSLVRDPSIDRVVGVDVEPPRRPLLGAEFVRADIRNPVIGRVLASADVDTVVHMGVIATPRQAGGRTVMKDINVIGTMQLLAACQKSESVRHLVVKSTASVYGAGPRDPALFTEDMTPKHPPTSGWAKDSVEVEGYVRGFARRRPDVTVSTLRLANAIGPRVETAMTAYFTLPLIPTVLGFDARLQFVHEDDAIAALHRAITAAKAGVFNIAGDGILAMSQAVSRTGRASVPVPGALLGVVGRALAPAKIVDFSAEQVRFLTYGRGIDTGRARRELGFTAPRTTSAAFDEFLSGHGLRPALAETVLSGADDAWRHIAARGGVGA
ncbi:MAG: NAD-dependent epimerase/dehydratase family protein [Actinobacteria bacterium]|nr:NAD-dependent epimerase/dehydratase family protein [Actinomycetota bacterium]